MAGICVPGCDWVPVTVTLVRSLLTNTALGKTFELIATEGRNRPTGRSASAP